MKRGAAGFTLVELLVVLLLASVVMTALLTMVLSSLTLYRTDTARAAVNQDVSVALTVITNDARQAGERMTRDAPALEVSGPVTARTLTVRRSLLDVVLPVCKDIRSGSSADVVFVSQPGKGNGGSGKLPDSCKASSDEVDFASWKAYRLAHGGSVNAYIYNPKTGRGENFDYDAEDGSGQHIHRGGGKWVNDYPVEDAPRVYLLEQLTYALQGGVLSLTRDRGEAQPFLPNVVSFEVDPYVPGPAGTPVKVTPAFPGKDQTWKDLAWLEVRITAKAQAGGRTVQRSFRSAFTPRNVFSADQ
ncbi:prepilin-type N-terminal cleavage/methylation domain-containing protein [Deinococcus sp. S9]|uniref:prepilin-type N-terminal cleavage/methylation domain-containing protein n=1 Tax=Deinococcus sp. S9 TaxID=2545754 RepID=UPI001404F320|nr:prepilin-type N-terminal cleavage/methylation domain-containing protein [Deinococcus sp. S9]